MSLIKKYSIVGVAFIFAFLLAEALLRSFTDFPVGEDNKIIDKDIGFRVSPHLRDIDIYGFRNRDDKWENYELAAIGDSHTFGYSVFSKQSWPSQFEQMTGVQTYNYGVGGNGIFAYHKLVLDELNKGKQVIVGLYIGNDFELTGSPCQIDFQNDFWRHEVQELNLFTPTCEVTINKQSQVVQGLKNFVRIKTIPKVALLSAVYNLIYKPLMNPNINKKNNSEKSYFYIDDQIVPISKQKVKDHHYTTSLKITDTNKQFHNFVNMIEKWDSIASERQLGILIFPSREAVYYSWLNVLEKLNSNSNFSKLVSTQLDLEQKIIDICRRLGVPIESTLQISTQLLVKTTSLGGVDDLYPDTGHPDVRGYAVYAKAAMQLYSTMNNK